MKKVFVVFLLFLLVCFATDRLLDYALFKSFLKSDCVESYAYQKCDADVVILGSSRAKHHYVPSIITDSLGLSCYNLGEDGKNIYFQYALLSLLLAHHTPKIVIYDCFSVDVIKTDFKYDLGSLSDLYPIYGKRNDVDALIDLQGPKFISRISFSHVYRYNSRFIDYLSSNHNNVQSGYVPLGGIYEGELGIINKKEETSTDDMKFMYIQKLIDLCQNKDIQIIFAVSPHFTLNENDGVISKKYERVNELCNKNDIPFLYYELDSTFLQRKDLFRDIGHLNDNGARLYTQLFVSNLKDVAIYRN